MLSEILESVKKLDGEPPDQTQTQSFKIVKLQEVVEVDAHQFEGDAEMLSEDDVVLHVNDVHRVFLVVLSQILEDLQLHSSLVVVLLLVLYDFDGHFFLTLVIEALDSYAERALAKELDYFVSVPYVIFKHYLVVSFVVIVAEVVFISRCSFDLRRTLSNIVNLRVI